MTWFTSKIDPFLQVSYERKERKFRCILTLYWLVRKQKSTNPNKIHIKTPRETHHFRSYERHDGDAGPVGGAEACGSAGWGGTIWMPTGCCYRSSMMTLGSMTSLEGVGWEDRPLRFGRKEGAEMYPPPMRAIGFCLPKTRASFSTISWNLQPIFRTPYKHSG
jgi:hypothetical protein